MQNDKGHSLDVNTEELTQEQKWDSNLTKLWDRVRDRSDQRYIVKDGLLWRKITNQLGDEAATACAEEIQVSRIGHHHPWHIGRDRTV